MVKKQICLLLIFISLCCIIQSQGILPTSGSAVFRIYYTFSPSMLDNSASYVRVSPDAKSSNQKWVITPIGGGYYVIQSYVSPQYLGGGWDGKVYVYSDSNSWERHWYFQYGTYVISKNLFSSSKSATGYHIRNRLTGRYLSVSVYSSEVVTDKSPTRVSGADDCVWDLYMA